MKGELSFEVKAEDLAGRVGKIKFKGGSLETPALLPVVNPRTREFPPEGLWQIGYRGLTTNAYLLWRFFREEAVEQGVHKLLNFQGFILTDSGAYQLLQYGDVEVSPLEIVDYQLKLKPDMAVILDVPTGWEASRRRAEWTVKETLKRAQEALNFLKDKRGNILWVGPVQGGKYVDLVAEAAREMGKLGFDAYALGSPTGIMEAYQFDLLTEMVLAAKKWLPAGKPFHLFGAGHPFMFSLAVALGCDTFDSAAYALYAKDGRYITEYGTVRLERLRYLACNCPACRRTTLEDLMELPRREREAFLMEHNLYVCLSEVERIKQSIVEGRLWEHLEVRARSHPALFQALKNLGKHWKTLEKTTPRWKPRGLFIFDEVSLSRPEVQRHREKVFRLLGNLQNRILLLLPEPEAKPYTQAEGYRKVSEILCELEMEGDVYVCFYNPVFGVTPASLADVYPLSQFEVAKPYGKTLLENMVEYLSNLLKESSFRAVIVHPDPSLLSPEQAGKLKATFTGWASDPWSSEALENLRKTLAQLKAFEGFTGL